MAVNKDPFVRTTRKDGLPSTTRLPVQAGSTATIKIGEICAWNKTANYATPITVEADFKYALLISKEEQKSDDSARYMNFTILLQKINLRLNLQRRGHWRLVTGLF